MKPLQVRAAELLRRGFTQREVARAVGRSERTIRVWLREVEGFRDAARSDASEGEVSPVETLQLALAATKGDGSPEWRIRVAAVTATESAADRLFPDRRRGRHAVGSADRSTGDTRKARRRSLVVTIIPEIVVTNRVTIRTAPPSSSRGTGWGIWAPRACA